MTAELSYLFSAANGATVDTGNTQIMTAGYSTVGHGGAVYVNDTAVTNAFMTANPRWSFIAADGRGFRLNEAIPDITMFGAVADDATDCYQAIIACLAYMDKYGITNMNWPEGKFYCSDTIQIKQQVILSGPSAGQEPGVFGTDNNYLRFPANKGGLCFNRYDMLGDAIVAGGGRADASIVRGLHLKGGGGDANQTYSGIKTGCRIKVEDCLIHGFAGHGIFIKGNGGGNANCWRIDTVRLWGNGKSGLRATGADANAGISTLVDASNNAEWGIHDDSFLGNKHDGFHMEFNTLGAWKTDGDSGIFEMHGYTEPGQPVAQASPKTTWSGNQFAEVVGEGTGLRSEGLDGGGLGSTRGYYNRKLVGDEFIYTMMGTDPSQAQHQRFIAYGSDWGIKSEAGGAGAGGRLFLQQANAGRAWTIGGAGFYRAPYAFAPRNLLLTRHGDGDFNTFGRRLALVATAADLNGVTVEVGDTFPLHSPVLGGPDRLIATNYGPVGTGSGVVTPSGIVGGIQMTAFTDLASTATLAETVTYLKALVGKLRASRQMSSSAPYAEFDFAFDPKNGFYRNGGLLTTDVTAMPGYSFTGTGPSITLGIGYSADTGDKLSFSRTVQAAPMLLYAVGTTVPQAGQSDILAELQNAGVTLRHILLRWGDSNLGTSSSLTGNDYAERFVPGATRIAMATWWDGTNHWLMVKVGTLVFPAVPLGAAASASYDRVAVGASGYANEEFGGNVEFVGIRYGMFSAADVTAILTAA